MPDPKQTERVQRFRKSRRERGDREMNVWVTGLIGAAIDHAIESGRFKNRQEAITHALEATFAQKERNVVT
jgi:Arc/MetJ-type ribon-helix-helix transcriptional regulator